MIRTGVLYDRRPEGSWKILRSAGIPDAEIIEASADNPARYIGLR
jgi:hypothetical protein